MFVLFVIVCTVVLSFVVMFMLLYVVFLFWHDLCYYMLYFSFGMMFVLFLVPVCTVVFSFGVMFIPFYVLLRFCYSVFKRGPKKWGS